MRPPHNSLAIRPALAILAANSRVARVPPFPADMMAPYLQKDASDLVGDAKARKHVALKFRPASQKEMAGLGDVPEGYVAGWASTPDLDSYRHRIMPGALQESITKRGLTGPQGIKLLIGHDWQKIGGVIKRLEYRGGKLWIEAQLNLELGYAKDAYLSAKMVGGVSFSVGIRLETYSIAGEEGDEFLRIEKADLYEVSVVAFPGNDAAEMTFIKSGDVPQITTVAEFERALVSSGLVKTRNEANRLTQEIKRLRLTAKPLADGPDPEQAAEKTSPMLALEKVQNLADLVAKMKATIAA